MNRIGHLAVLLTATLTISNNVMAQDEYVLDMNEMIVEDTVTFSSSTEENVEEKLEESICDKAVKKAKRYNELVVKNKNKPDTTPPKVKSISIKNSIIRKGDARMAEVEAVVTDDLSDVKSVELQFFCEDNYQAKNVFLGQKGKNKWIGQIDFLHLLDSGKYVLNLVVVTDTAGNSKNIYRDDMSSKLKNVAFEIQDPKEHIAATINNLEFGVTKYTLKDDDLGIYIPVTADVDVKEAKIESILVMLRKKGTTDSSYFYLEPCEEDGKLVYKCSNWGFYNTRENIGTWKVYEIVILGENSTGMVIKQEDLPENIKDAKIVIKSKSKDKEGPVIKSVKFEKSKLNMGKKDAKVKVIVEAKDDSKIGYANLVIRETRSGKFFRVHLNASTSGKKEYIGYIEISSHIASGVYKVDNAIVSDVFGNTRYYGKGYERLTSGMKKTKLEIVNSYGK